MRNILLKKEKNCTNITGQTPLVERMEPDVQICLRQSFAYYYYYRIEHPHFN